MTYNPNKETLNQAMQLSDEEKKERISKIKNFQLCGVDISQFKYDEETKLITIRKGLCRITMSHLIASASSKNYKKYLEREIKLGR